MATPPGLYTIRIKGRLGATALSAFPSMVSELKGSETVLTGLLEDRSAVFGVLAQIEALGLELLELRQIRARATSRESGDDRMNTTTFLGDKPINRMGYGAMQLAGPGVFGPPRDPSAARAVLRRAIELGVDHIDTSQYYGPDVVNDLIRQALHPYPENLKLVTKVGARRDDAGRVLPAQRPDELRAGVEANLRSLRVERLDLVNLRLVDDDRRHRDTARGAVICARGHAPGGQARSDRALQCRSSEGAASARVRRGGRDPERLQHHRPPGRRDGRVCSGARDRVRAVLSPLARRSEAGQRGWPEKPQSSEVADKHGATPTQIALAWLLARYDRMLLIPGTSSVAHLEENMAAIELELDDDDIAALDRVDQRDDGAR